MGFAGILRALASGMEARVSAANEQAARFLFLFFRRIASQRRGRTVWGLGFRVLGLGTFSKLLYVVALHSKYTRALTLQNFCEAHMVPT